MVMTPAGSFPLTTPDPPGKDPGHLVLVKGYERLLRFRKIEVHGHPVGLMGDLGRPGVPPGQ